MTLANVIGTGGVESPWGKMGMIFPEGSSQTFQQNWLVDLGSGLVAVAGNGQGANFAAGDFVLGRPQRAATGTARTAIAVEIATDLTFFDLPVYGSGGTNLTLAEGQLGTKYELYRNSSDVFYVDLDQTTNTKVIVVGFVNDPKATVPGSQGAAYNVTGETAGHVWAKVIAAQRQLG